MQNVIVIALLLFATAECLTMRKASSSIPVSMNDDPPVYQLRDYKLRDYPESSVLKYPPEECNEESLYEAKPRCEELCRDFSSSHHEQAPIKLLSSKRYSCQSFWFDNFATDEECEQNAEQARSNMLQALCGEGGICHEAEMPKKTKKTRGIVFTAARGGWGLVAQTLRLLRGLRQARPVGGQTKTNPESEDSAEPESIETLPAEIMIDSEAELEDCQHEFEGGAGSWLAKCIVPSRKPADLVKMGARGQYGYKGMALLESSFDEVLFLDEDVVPVHDPALLFESCEFKRTGALFMPDMFGYACKDNKQAGEPVAWGQSSWPEHVMWAVTGGKWEPKWPLAQEFESGAMLVDKTKHLKALKLALHFIESVEVQKMMYGDKDCFKHAFVALGESYALSSDRPTRLLMQIKDNPAMYNGIGELQRMMGVYMFTHHLPRTLNPTVIQNDAKAFNINQSVALVVPQSRQGKTTYSYCPLHYGAYSSHEYRNLMEGHWFACFPKQGLPCSESEFYGKPSGLLQDAVEALQFIAGRGF